MEYLSFPLVRLKGEAEALALAMEEKSDYVVVDDRLARLRSRALGPNVIGTLRVLRMFFDAKIMSKIVQIKVLEELRIFFFRVSSDVAKICATTIIFD